MNILQEPGGAESRMDADMAADNDRSGFLVHPKLGRIATYVAEEKTNVHYYFDKNSGTWIRVPMSWELYSDFAKEKLDIIQVSSRPITIALVNFKHFS